MIIDFSRLILELNLICSVCSCFAHCSAIKAAIRRSFSAFFQQNGTPTHVFSSKYFKIFKSASLRKKCLYSELFWSAFSRFRTEYGEILRISPYLVRMRKNTDQYNSEYGLFSRSTFFTDQFRTITSPVHGKLVLVFSWMILRQTKGYFSKQTNFYLWPSNWNDKCFSHFRCYNKNFNFI